MCGIVGIAGNTFQREMKVFRDMLIFDQVRGFDSTGVCAIGLQNTKPLVEKDLDGPDNLWNCGQSNIFDYRGVSKVCNKVMLGHNRAATIGSIVVDNAHPFTFGHITGVHNGSLSYWNELDFDDDGVKFDVDSKALYQTIANKGIDTAWERFIGAASLVWWDEKDETLNFIRNEDRPMYMARNQAGDVLLWASEAWMIEVAAARNNLKLKVFEEEVTDQVGRKYTKKYSIYPTKTNHLFKYKVTAANVELVEDRELEKKKWGTTTYSGGVGRTTTGESYRNEDPKRKINGSWAKGKAKAGKEQVGRAFQYRHVVHVFRDGISTPYLVGQFLDGNNERIEIYPRTFGEFEELYEEATSGDVTYILGCRPRIITDYQKKFFAFGVEPAYIKMKPPTFRNVTGKKSGEVVTLRPPQIPEVVEEDQWEKSLHAAGGCCDFCGMSIDLEDAPECLWLGEKSVICPGCKDDRSYLNFLQQERQG